ncbi:hypothetical protein [Neisseria sp.]|uniref:hypothetical protein n=1 Tax=Neisseria sp. TaxID=192066 RepID=UPI0035A0FEC2
MLQEILKKFFFVFVLPAVMITMAIYFFIGYGVDFYLYDHVEHVIYMVSLITGLIVSATVCWEKWQMTDLPILPGKLVHIIYDFVIWFAFVAVCTASVLYSAACIGIWWTDGSQEVYRAEVQDKESSGGHRGGRNYLIVLSNEHHQESLAVFTDTFDYYEKGDIITIRRKVSDWGYAVEEPAMENGSNVTN